MCRSIIDNSKDAMSVAATAQGRYVFAALLLLVIFSPLIEGGTTHLPLAVIRLGCLWLLIAWFLHSLKQNRLVFCRTDLDLPILLFLVIAIFSTARSSYLHVSIQWLGVVFTYAIFYFLVIHVIHDRRQIRYAIYALIAMGCFESLVGIAQWVYLGYPRPKGTFYNPNFLAGYLVPIAALVLALALSRASVKWTERSAGIVIFAIMVATIMLTGSRGGALVLFVAVSSVLWLRYGKVTWIVMLVTVLLLAIIPNPLPQRILSEHQNNPFAYSRFDIWQSSIDRAIDYPLGVGMGMYKYLSQQYPTPQENVMARYARRAKTAHNEYLHMTVELGFAGVGVFCWGMVRLRRIIQTTRRIEGNQRDHDIVIGLAGGILGILTHAVVDSSFHQPGIVLLLVLLGAFIVILHRWGTNGTRRVQVAVPRTRFAVFALVFMGIIASVVIIRPAVAWYTYLDGSRLLSAGDIEQSVERFNVTVFLDPGNAKYHDALAAAFYHRLRQSTEWSWGQEAIAVIDYAIHLNPLDARYYSSRGMVYQTIADMATEDSARQWALGEARTSYHDAIDQDPYSPGHYVDHARILVSLEEPHQARVNLIHAVELEPNYLPARWGLARLYEQLGLHQKAAVEYRELLTRKARYQGEQLTPLEQTYLDVDTAKIKDAIASRE